LPVEYSTASPGQIRQRNLGLVHMDERTPLIGFLDDDLILEPDALERMIEFWNRAEPDTAGVASTSSTRPRIAHPGLHAFSFALAHRAACCARVTTRVSMRST
jgi:glycosyltransferase involved in cell wall biosynthesis